MKIEYISKVIKLQFKYVKLIVNHISTKLFKKSL